MNKLCRRINSIVSMPIITDKYTNNDLSFFLTALIPKTKAVISIRNATGTVTSHQLSSKESIFNIKTNTKEVVITARKNMFKHTDHLPNFVFGFISITYLGVCYF